MNSCVWLECWMIAIMSRRVGFRSQKQITTFHLNHLDVFHNATHSLIVLVMELYQNQTWHHTSILGHVPAALRVRWPISGAYVLLIVCVVFWCEMEIEHKASEHVFDFWLWYLLFVYVCCTIAYAYVVRVYTLMLVCMRGYVVVYMYVNIHTLKIIIIILMVKKL